MKHNTVLVAKYDYGYRTSYHICISCGAGLWVTNINKEKAERIISRLEKMSIVKHTFEIIPECCNTERWSCSKIEF